MRKDANGNLVDALDIERFKTMIESSAFAVFRSRMNEELERARRDCERAVDLRTIRLTQGRIATLRSVISLPEIILLEMR